MTDPSLAEITAELFAVRPAEFVSERNARAKQVADRELAAQIRVLRKPSIAAWVVNVFAAERADRLGQALKLAGELREAQEDLDAQALAKLGRDRRALTRQLANEAASLAAARGERVSGSTLEAVQQTITAAFFDPDAAAAVASGRLLRELEPSADFDFTVIAGGVPEPEPKSAATRPDEVRARRMRKEAEKAVHAAERELALAEREHTKADSERDAAATRADRLAAKVQELETDLERARGDAKTARKSADLMGDRVTETAGRVSAAESAVDAARKALGTS